MRNLAGAVFATIQDYPSIAGGSCAFLVALALVAGNAMLGQPGGHPDPLWATRDRVTTQSVDTRQAPLPVRRVSVETVSPRLDTLSVIPVPTKRPTLASDPVVSKPAQDRSDLVRNTQQALAALGLYKGDVDGVYGRHTRDAVLDFQRANGLATDGEVSRVVLEEALALAKQSADTGKASERTLASRTADAVDNDKSIDGVDDVERRMSGYNAPRMPEPRIEQASVSSPVSVVESPEDIARAAMIARIQIGLLNFGEAGISVDGVLGPHTVDAIRSFQDRYGLPVTGEPEQAVIRKMEQIGALHNS